MTPSGLEKNKRLLFQHEIFYPWVDNMFFALTTSPLVQVKRFDLIFTFSASFFAIYLQQKGRKFFFSQNVAKLLARLFRYYF